MHGIELNMVAEQVVSRAAPMIIFSYVIGVARLHGHELKSSHNAKAIQQSLAGRVAGKVRNQIGAGGEKSKRSAGFRTTTHASGSRASMMDQLAIQYGQTSGLWNPHLIISEIIGANMDTNDKINIHGFKR
eukprot:3131136-Amphidinium_carterae.1